MLNLCENVTGVQYFVMPFLFTSLSSAFVGVLIAIYCSNDVCRACFTLKVLLTTALCLVEIFS